MLVIMAIKLNYLVALLQFCAFYQSASFWEKVFLLSSKCPFRIGAVPAARSPSVKYHTVSSFSASQSLTELLT